MGMLIPTPLRNVTRNKSANACKGLGKNQHTIRTQGDFSHVTASLRYYKPFQGSLHAPCHCNHLQNKSVYLCALWNSNLRVGNLGLFQMATSTVPESPEIVLQQSQVHNHIRITRKLSLVITITNICWVFTLCLAWCWEFYRCCFCLLSTITLSWCSEFRDEDSKDWKRVVAAPRSHSKLGAWPGFKPRSVWVQNSGVWPLSREKAMSDSVVPILQATSFRRARRSSASWWQMVLKETTHDSRN